MFSTLQLRIVLTFLFVVVVGYVSFVNNELEVIPGTIFSYKSSSSEPTSDKNVNKKDLTVFNVGQNFTTMTAEFFKYMASQLADKPYAGVDNYTQYITAKLNLKPLAGVKPLRPEYGPVINDVTSYEYSIQIEPCRYVRNSSNLFIAIISAVGNFEKRSGIRNTWIKHLPKNQSDDDSSFNLSGYGFIVGQATDKNISFEIEEESKKYGDILQVGIIDYYFNLTLKAVGLVNWLNSYCSEVDFVLKVDDDVFVNVRNVGAVISKALNRSEMTYYGTSTWHPTERGGKWGINHEDYPWDEFPSYPTGAATLLPGIAIRSLLAAAQVTPFLPFDDSYLLGLLPEKAGMKLVGSERMLALGGNFGPCHVYHFVTWLPGWDNNMNISYWATEDFYKNETQCYLERDGVNQTVNPELTIKQVGQLNVAKAKFN